MNNQVVEGDSLDLKIRTMSRQDILQRAPSACTGHFLALLSLLGFSDLIQANPFVVWITSGVLLLICVTRVYLAFLPPQKVLRHFQSYIWLIYGSAVCWAVLNISSFHGSNSFTKEWLISGFVMAAVAAASLASLAPERNLTRFFLVVVLLPPCIDFIFFQDDLLVIGLMLFTYLALLIRQAELHSNTAYERYRALIELDEQKREIEIHRAHSIQSAKMSSLGEMSGAVAHEINNPLTIIHGLAFQMARQIEKESVDLDRFRTATEKITATVDRITRIIKGLRSFARDGSRDPFEAVRPRLIVEEALALSQERFLSQGIKLEINNYADEAAIHARPTQLAQVLLNLLNNSYQAVLDQSSKWIRLDIIEKDGKVSFRVTDSGKGVPEEVVDRIMEPFFTTKPLGEGTGLGLSISMGITKDHGGRLYYDRESPHTSFVMEVPRVSEPAQHEVTALTY